MNTYDYIKDSITVPQAAERYGMKIGRGGMVCCPFHDDRHPSMKLNERYFYCFGCGAHGDVIDLAARLLGTSTKDTISILQADFGLDPGNEHTGQTEPRRPAIHQFRQDENGSAAVLTAVLHLFQQWKKEYAPDTPDNPLDDHYVLACRHTEALEYALDILSVGELEDRVALVDRLTKTGKLEQIRKILNEYGAGDLCEELQAS